MNDNVDRPTMRSVMHGVDVYNTSEQVKYSKMYDYENQLAAS